MTARLWGSTTTLALTKKQVLGHLGSKNADIATLAALVSHGRLDLSRSISDIVPLADFQKGIKKLRDARGQPYSDSCQALRLRF